MKNIYFMSTDWHIDLPRYASENVDCVYDDIVNKHLPALIERVEYIKSRTSQRLIYLNLGDLGDTSKMSPTMVDVVEKIFIKILSVFDAAFVLEGNHTQGTMKFLENVGVHVVADISVIDIAGDSILAIPHVKMQSSDVYMEAQRLLKVKAKIDFIIGHYMPVGFAHGSEDTLIGAKELTLGTFGTSLHTFVGHVHKKQDNGFVHSIGSAARIDMAEREEEKGFTIYYGDDNIEFVPVEVQTMQYVKLEKKPTAAQLKSMQRCIVKLFISENNENERVIIDAINSVGFVKDIEYLKKSKSDIEKSTIAIKSAVETANYNASLKQWIDNNVKNKKIAHTVYERCSKFLKESLREYGIQNLYIERVILHNYLSMGDADIMFPVGIVGIVGENGSGKSTIIDSIAGASYTQHRAAYKEVLRDGSKDFKIEIVFSNGATISAIYDGVTYKTILKHSEVNLQNKEAIEYIANSLIGLSAEAFKNTIFFTQDDQEEFARSTPAQRYDYFKEFLQVDAIDNLREKESKNLNAYDASISADTGKIEATQNEINEQKKRTCSTVVYKKACEDLKEVKVQITILEKQRSKLLTAKNQQGQLTRLNSQLEEHEENLTEYRATLEKLQKQIEDTVIIKKPTSDVDAIDKEERAAQKDLAELEVEIEQYELILETKKCPYGIACTSMVDSKFILSIESKLDVTRTARNAVFKKIQHLQAKLNNAEKAQSEYDNYVRAFESAKQKVDSVRVRIEDCKNNIKQIKKSIAEIPVFNQKEFDKIDKQYSDTTEKSQQLLSDKLTYETSQANITRLTKSLKVLKTSIAKAKQERAVCEHCVNALGRDGFMRDYISTVIEYVSTESNKMLKVMGADYTIDMSLARSRNTVGVLVSIKSACDVTRSYDTYSGAQKMLATIAMRLSIAKLLRMRGNIPSFLVLDEIFGRMTAVTARNVMTLIKSLRNHFSQVFIITHTDMQEQLPHIIEAVRVDGVSTANVVR